MIDSEAIATLQHELGRQLAACREAAGVSQARLASYTGYSRSTVANVETGRQSVPPPFWRRCDECLATVDTLTTRYEALQALKQQRKRDRADALKAERAARLVPPAATPVAAPIAAKAPADTSVEWPADLAATYAQAAALWAEELDRSPLSAHDASASTAVALRWLVATGDPAPTRDTGWRRIGRADVDRIRAVRRQLKAIDNAHGGGAAFPMAAAYLRREVAPLLTGRYDNSTGQALFGAVAELSLDVGWMAYDAGGHRLGRRYMTSALRLSHAAEDRLFGGRVLAAISHQALHLGQVALAVDLVRAARTGAAQVAPPHAVAMLAAMEAMAQAAGGASADCTAALVAAERALERARTDDDNPDWLDFGEGGLWGHAARAYRYLQRGRDCARYAQDAIAHCRRTHGRTRAQRAAILAAAHVQLGQLDQAAALGVEVVADAWNLHSRHVYEEVATLTRALDGRRAKSCIDQFVPKTWLTRRNTARRAS